MTAPGVDPRAATPRKRKPPRTAVKAVPGRPPTNANGDRLFTADPALIGAVYLGRTGKERGRVTTITAVLPDGRYATSTADGREVPTSANTLHRRYDRIGVNPAVAGAAVARARAALAAALAAVPAAITRAARRRAEGLVIAAKERVVVTLPDPTVPRSTRGRPAGTSTRGDADDDPGDAPRGSTPTP